MDENPLVGIESVIPWERIEASHVEPAVDHLLAEARTAIDDIAQAQTQDYDTVLQALEDATEPLSIAMSVVGHLESVSTSDALRQAYDAVQPKVAVFSSSIPLDARLWGALRAVQDSPAAAALDAVRGRHLGKTVDDFRRHGAELDDTGKERLSALDVELAQITTKFAQNVLDATNAWSLVIEDEAQLSGLPESARAAARAAADEAGVGGWRFSLQAPSYIPLMTYLDDRAVREKAWRAFGTRATSGEHDNRPLVRKILELRREKATLLGYDDFADLVLEDRMAGRGVKARDFVADLRAKSVAAFEQENVSLAQYAAQRGGPEALRPWDVAYWAEKQRQEAYDFDAEALRPYFAFEKVLDGIFGLVQRLYGVTIEPAPDVGSWHESVQAYRLRDGEETLGEFWVDAYPRSTKRDGAWMNGLVAGRMGGGRMVAPHLGLVCANVTPPVDGKPALLTHREVETLFHEFGHLMHHLLSRVEVRALGGTNVAWDFVELPSQIMENWCWERDCLDTFAAHWESGEPIPDALFDAMKRARTFRGANAMMRQLGFGALDLALHVDWAPGADATDPVALALDVMRQHSAAPLPDDYAMVASFTHLFAHPVGYAAAYYSYKWAEVLDADAFTRFAQTGIFDAGTGDAFRRSILERGDAADPMDLYVAFMGREPEPEALLRRSGLAAG